jgi:hypothetical protein
LACLSPVELLDRTDEPDDPFLDQIEQRQAVALVALRDRDDQAEVRVDHPLLRLHVAALDPLRELDLLLRDQKRPAAGLVQEQLERVRRLDREVAVDVRRPLGLTAAVVAHLDSALVELLVEAADVLVVQLVLGGELIEPREVDATLTLSLGDQRVD